jgi:hypothetical protein
MGKLERHEPVYPVHICLACQATFPPDASFRQDGCPLGRCPKMTIVANDREELNAIRRFGRPVGTQAATPTHVAPTELVAAPEVTWDFSDMKEAV